MKTIFEGVPSVSLHYDDRIAKGILEGANAFSVFFIKDNIFIDIHLKGQVDCTIPK